MSYDQDASVDYYVMLQVDRTATTQEIERSYKRLVRETHSDRMQDDEEAMKIGDELTQKYNRIKDVLCDPEKRRLYDMHGEEGLLQLAQVTGNVNVDRLSQALHHSQMQRERQKIHELASANGEYQASINAQNSVARFIGSGKVSPMVQGVAQVGIHQNFSHRVSNSTRVIFDAGLSVGQGGPPLDLVHPQDPTGLQRHRVENISSNQHLSITLENSPENSAVERSVGVKFSESTTLLTASLQQPIGPADRLSVLLEGSLDVFNTPNSDVSVVARADLTPNSMESRWFLDVGVYPKPFYASLIGANAKTQFRATATMVGDFDVTWVRNNVGQVTVGASDGEVYVSYSLARQLDDVTSLHVGSRLGVDSGLSWFLQYHRHTQKIIVPIQLSDELPSFGWLATLFLAPAVADLLVRHVILRPYKNMLRARRQALHDAEVRRVLAEQRMMRSHAERKRLEEEQMGGLVVLRARYGYDVENDDAENVSWIDVSIPLQHRVSTDGDTSRIIMPASTPKPLLPGWMNPAPQEDLYLEIQYTFGGVYHEAELEDDEPLMLPSKRDVMPEHSAPSGGKRWWHHGFEPEEPAEGAAGYSGID